MLRLLVHNVFGVASLPTFAYSIVVSYWHLGSDADSNIVRCVYEWSKQSYWLKSTCCVRDTFTASR